LSYVVGITSALVVWPPGVKPLPPKPYGGMGRPPVVPRRTRARQPVSVKELAHSLPATAFTTLSWREGSNETLSGRFAAVCVRHAGGNTGKARLRPEQWLLIEWPASDADPLKYYLSKLPADTALEQLVAHAHLRWRIERDYQDLKQELGLGHYEGRGWRGFHHHAALAIAAYGFLLSERVATGTPVSGKKKLRSTPDTCSSRRLHCAGKSGAHSATRLTRLPPFATNLQSGWSPDSMCVHAAEIGEDALI
jgi:SRSO17 transposase